MASLSVALHNQRSELTRLADLVERFGAEHHLSPDDVTNVNLVLDEVVSNVMRHGFQSRDGQDPVIDVSLAIDGLVLTVAVTDNGIAFDPRSRPAPDLDLPIEQRPIGGLGIHIVKALSETIEYSRHGDRNRLTMTMRVGR